MHRRDLLRGSALALGAIAAGAAPVRAQAKMTFKASDVHAPGYPTVVAVENLGKKLEQATSGRLGVQMYASMQLGGEKEAIEQAQVGAIQLARISVGAIGPVIDDLNVLNLPFLFRNTAHMQKVIDGPIGQELLDKVTANGKAGLVGLCWMDAGARNFYDTKHPIRSIGDLKGLKIRVIGNPMFVDMVNALGANGVAMGYDQVFSALQTGVIDGAENNPPSFVFDNHYQVAKFYTRPSTWWCPRFWCSRARPGTPCRPPIRRCWKFAAEAQADERTCGPRMKSRRWTRPAAGIQIVETIDKKPFQDAVKPIWDKYGPRIRRPDKTHSGVGLTAGPSSRGAKRRSHPWAARSQ